MLSLDQSWNVNCQFGQFSLSWRAPFPVRFSGSGGQLKQKVLFGTCMPKYFFSLSFRSCLQEQLRRLNRIENGADKPSPEASSKKKLKKEPSQLKVRCGACGGIGHMRTNKVCPMAGDVINVAMTKEQEELQLGRAVEESGQVKTEGSKIIISKEILNQAEQVRRDSLIIKIPKQLADVRALNKLEKGYGKKERKEREEMEGESSSSSRRKKMRLESLPDYLEKPRQTTARRRIDPVVSLSSILEDILNEIRELPGCEPFR